MIFETGRPILSTEVTGASELKISGFSNHMMKRSKMKSFDEILIFSTPGMVVRSLMSTFFDTGILNYEMMATS